MSANHYHSAGAQLEGIGTDSPGPEHHSALAIESLSMCLQQCVRIQNWAAGWMETQLLKRGQKPERAGKREVFSRERWKHCSPGHSGSSQLCFPGFALPTGGFLPGCQGGGCEVCVCSPCDIPVITVTCRWLTPTMTEATEGLVLCSTRQLVSCVIVRLPFLWEEI